MRNFYRKTKPKIRAIKHFIEEQKLVTSRQVFYHLVTKGLVKNTFGSYVTTCGLINELRYQQEIPFESISDITSLYAQTQYEDIFKPLDRAIEEFRSLWRNHFPDNIEVWLEKEALADIVFQVTNKYGIRLSVSKGRTKVSQIFSFIMRANEENKPSTIFYLGDFDPTGIHIDKNLREQFNKQTLYIKFPEPLKIERIALTETQIESLPSTQLAKTRDPNYEPYVAKYGKIAYELDALTPKQLQKIIENTLEKYRPFTKIQELIETDKKEKENAYSLIHS